MLINPDEIIKRRIVYNLIDRDTQVQQNGIDLTLKSLYKLNSTGTILKDKSLVSVRSQVVSDASLKYNLRGSSVYEVIFNEGIYVPEKICAKIIGRSSLLRCGTVVTSTLFDSGFQDINIGCFLFTSLPIVLEQDARLAQILFMFSDNSKMYEGQWQNLYEYEKEEKRNKD